MDSSASRTPNFETSAILELILASALWGFGFIATAWALRELSPVSLIGCRMFFAFSFGMVICFVIPSLRRQLAWDQFRLSFWPGLFLCATMVLQTWGLQYTTVTKCGFITTLYVLIVPILERVMLGRKIPKYHMIYVFIALIGMAFICDLPQIFRRVTAPGTDPKTLWNLGDWITLACAFAASLQIVWFGKIQNDIRSSFIFNVYQTFWTGLLPFFLMFFFEKLPTHMTGLPLLGMFELIVGSTMIAFSLQVRAQKRLSPSVSSLVFLLESPFAAIFGFLILSETPTALTLIGAVIILVALIASVVFSKEGTTKALVE
jgi:drug/metabolite transporter (DMT)-like permease